MKLATVVGARPQLIKAAALSRAVARYNNEQKNSHHGGPVEELLIHTGQHYDYEMSAVFFSELGLSAPAHHLGVGSGSHGQMTGETLRRVEDVLLAERPDVVLVHGDTNSTLAGALAAAKLALPVAHVEAGLRSFNRAMPEEVNRVLTDRLSRLLYCPSERAVAQLRKEGIQEGVELVGDVMHDLLLVHEQQARAGTEPLAELGLEKGAYALATVHRAGNTDDPERLRALLQALAQVASAGLPVVLPLHPRTRKQLGPSLPEAPGVHLVPPASYMRILTLLCHARVVATDSGGLQKEAYWLGVPCVTLREETEWVETVELGWNVLAGGDPATIVAAVLGAQPLARRPPLYGDGHAADRIVASLLASGDRLRP